MNRLLVARADIWRLAFQLCLALLVAMPAEPDVQFTFNPRLIVIDA